MPAFQNCQVTVFKTVDDVAGGSTLMRVGKQFVGISGFNDLSVEGSGKSVSRRFHFRSVRVLRNSEG